jgi:hypothetical protein
MGGAGQKAVSCHPVMLAMMTVALPTIRKVDMELRKG